jgi:hypothetical protein
MRALMDLLENDSVRAHVHFLRAWRLGDRAPLPETAAGLALLARLNDETEETVGWLKRALSGRDQRFNIRLINHEAWRPLWDNPSFLSSAEREGWPFHPDRPLDELLAGARTSGAASYLGQNRLPDGYTAPLKLQEHEPGTRVRTLTGLSSGTESKPSTP